MRTTVFAAIIAIVAIAASSDARAQEGDVGIGGGGSSAGFGVGVEAMLSGPRGPAFVYQTSAFRISALLAFDTGVDEDFVTDDVAIAGRFYYVLHSGEISDFSVGGGFGIEDDDGGNDDVDLHLEGGAQIRAFIVPNVALSASLGLAIELDEDGMGNNDDDLDVAFTGQLTAGFGVTYFFW